MIIFQNPGLIDLAAVETFGANIKINANSIGQFGTGLKYAIAVILRNGGSFTIFRGKEHVPYTTQPGTIRDKDFDFVYQDTRRMAFTTEFGKNWEPWQAFRELWSNCMDEGGKVWHIDESDPDQWHQDGRAIDQQMHFPDDHTTIVWMGEAAEKAWEERSTVLLATEPLTKLPEVDVHPGESEFIYYQGIRVYKLPKKSKFTYNLTTHVSLTEERLLAYFYYIPSKLARAIVQCGNAAVIESVLTSSDLWLEGDKIDWEDAIGTAPSDIFIETSMKLRADDQLQGNARKLFRAFKDTYVHRGWADPEIVEMSVVERNILKEAIEIAAAKNINTDGVLFNARNGMDEDNYFQYRQYGDTVSLNIELFKEGAKSVAKAIVMAMAWRAGGTDKDQLAHFLIYGEFDNAQKSRSPRDRELIF